MKLKENKKILIRLYHEYVQKHLSKIFLALILSIVVAGTTSSIAWLLDPAVKKIFIEKDNTYAWLIPLLIIITFSLKGFSLYVARMKIIRVGQEWLKKKNHKNILTTDMQTLDNRPLENIYQIFYTKPVSKVVSVAVLNLMKIHFQ